jgi:hypothetical protein
LWDALRFVALTTVVIKNFDFWDIMLLRPLKVNFIFCLIHADFLLELPFDP